MRSREAQPDKLDGLRETWLGAAVVTAALVALGCLAVDGRDGLVQLSDLRNQLWVGFTLYSLDHVALAGALLLAGIGLIVVRSPASRMALAAVSGLFAAQLAGLGMVAFRKWPAFAGSYHTIPDWGSVKALAAVMAGFCAIAAIASLVVVLRFGEPQRRALLLTVPLGMVVAVALPFLLPWVGADVPDRIAVALQYGLPLGIALAVTGVMELRPAVIVAVAVAASGLLIPLSRAFAHEHLGAAIGLVVASALATVLWRIRRTTTPGH